MEKNRNINFLVRFRKYWNYVYLLLCEEQCALKIRKIPNSQLPRIPSVLPAKKIMKTSYLGAQTSLYLWRKITDSHGTYLDDNEQTYLSTPTLHFYPILVENHHVLDAPARTILAFHEKHEHAHTDTKQVASRSSVSLQNEFLPPIGPRYFLKATRRTKETKDEFERECQYVHDSFLTTQTNRILRTYR